MEMCVAGECVTRECEAASSFCSGNTVRKCADDGLSSQELDTCTAGEYCEAQSASCVPGTCAPNQPACDGNRATVCNANGSGYEAGGMVCGDGTSCDAGLCALQVCTPGEDFCEAGSVRACAQNGLASMVKSECSLDQYCDEDTVSCQDEICTPNTATCDDNDAVTCNAEGSATTTTSCEGQTPYCVAGHCVECQPGERRCSGAQPQLCSDDGGWVNDGAACSGALVCDVYGGSTCTPSPLVPGGTFNRINSASYPATVSSFRLDAREVTVAAFRSFVTAVVSSDYAPAAGSGKHAHLNGGSGLALTSGGFETGWNSNWNDELPGTRGGWNSALGCFAATWTSEPANNENKPINCVNWFQAQAYCIRNLGFLPSEAEWNYAAAGGAEQRTYPWGATEPAANANLAAWGCYYSGACNATAIAPVGVIPAGNGRYGHSDLAGNVAEWTLDNSMLMQSCNDCATLGSATTRGGHFASFFASELATTSRPSVSRSTSTGTVGFRCARSP
jgi:formylglycine-generating enzyme required for sulfatase activity